MFRKYELSASFEFMGGSRNLERPNVERRRSGFRKFKIVNIKSNQGYTIIYFPPFIF